MSEKPKETPGQPDKANGTAMVVVGCKLPNGLICELGKPGDDNYTRVVLNGANASQVAGGFGLTSVSKAFWESWRDKHKRLDFVRKGLVFMHTDMASAVDHAKDSAGLRSGLEPLDPFKKVHNEKGEVVLEVDRDHFTQAQRAAAQAGAFRAAG